MTSKKKKITMMVITASMVVLLCSYLIFYGMNQEIRTKPIKVLPPKEKYLESMEYDRVLMDFNKVIIVEPNPTSVLRMDEEE